MRRIGAGHTAAAVERVPDRVPQPRKQGIRVSHLSFISGRPARNYSPTVDLLQRVLDAYRGRGHGGGRGRPFPLVSADVPEVG